MGRESRRRAKERRVKRILTFKAKDRRFGFIWQALVLSSLQEQKKRSFETMRREARLVETLEGISAVVEGGTLPSGDPAREVIAEQTLILEQADIDVLKGYIEDIQWKPTATVGAVDAHDWLGSAPESLKVAEAAAE